MVKRVSGNSDNWQDIGKLSSMSCIVPFRQIEIYNNGDVTICCHSWLPVYTGNILKDGIDGILQHTNRISILNDMRKGMFTQCTDLCPRLNSFLTETSTSDHEWAIVTTDSLDAHLEKTPYIINFSYDRSCNLQCPSCRTQLIYEKPNTPAWQSLIQIHNLVKALVIYLTDQGHPVSLHITGSGDAFASPMYWNYLQELADTSISDKISLYLYTNGIMMTAKKWERLKHLKHNIEYVSISIDAATTEVYNVVRKGGNFEKLKQNLNDFNQLIIDGNFPTLKKWQSNFIVQHDNFRDLKKFVEWQLSYDTISVIWLNQIANWGHVSDDDFKRMAVWDKNHPDYKELIDILSDPIFKHHKISPGNLSSLIYAKKD